MSQETDCGCLVVQLDVSAQTQKTVVSSDTIWRPATLNGHCVDPPIGGNGSSSDSCRRTNGGWRRLWAKVSRPLLLTLSLTASTGLGLCLLRVAIRPLPRMSLTMGYDLRSDGPPGGSPSATAHTRSGLPRDTFGRAATHPPRNRSPRGPRQTGGAESRDEGGAVQGPHGARAAQKRRARTAQTRGRPSAHTAPPLPSHASRRAVACRPVGRRWDGATGPWPRAVVRAALRLKTGMASAPAAAGGRTYGVPLAQRMKRTMATAPPPPPVGAVEMSPGLFTRRRGDPCGIWRPGSAPRERGSPGPCAWASESCGVHCRGGRQRGGSGGREFPRPPGAP